MALLVSLLAVAVVSVTVVAQETLNYAESRTLESESNGSANFQYFSPKAKNAAGKLQGLVTDVAEALEENVEQLKASSSAAVARNKAREVAESVKGTECAASEEEQDQISGAQGKLETAINNCVASAPQGYLDEQKKQTTKGLEKVQTIDNNLRLNSNLCTSLRVPPSQACKDFEKKALDRLKDTVSHGEMAKYQYYSREAFFNTWRSIESCSQNANKALQEDLENLTKRLEDCKHCL